MSAASWLQLIVFIVVVVVTAYPIGIYMAKVYGDDEKAPGDRFFRPIDNAIYKICRIDPKREQRWTIYAYSLIAFSIFSFLAVYALQRFQGHLPFNPTDVGGVVPHLSFNTAISFMTNTNWQSYGGEATMSHLTQMVGLAVQNFVSAAAGMATLAALIRGLSRRRASTIGNFWVDLVRSTTRILLPLAFVVAIVLVSQGVIQNFHGFTTAHTVQGATEQLIPGGPVASQIAIKQLGTNGGGFFNVNSAHPFENSTPFNNFIEMWAILVLPFAFAFTFGRMVKDKRQGYAVFAVMFVVWLAMATMAMDFEGNGNPEITAAGTSQSVTSTQGGGNMEGKEVRFGSAASGLWAASTTGTSNGSVNSMHDSFTPLGGAVPMSHMMLGEISPGGVGVGLSGLLIMAILSVFIAGLMVGRTPEYLGKKVQAPEMKMVALYVLAMPTAVLVLRRRLALRAVGAPHDDLEPGAARLQRDPLRVHVRREQQRLCVRRDHRCNHMDGHHLGHRDAHGSLLPRASRPCPRRRLCSQASDARHRRHLPHAHPSLRRPRHRRRRHRGWAHLLPGHRARPSRRAALALGASVADATF